MAMQKLFSWIRPQLDFYVFTTYSISFLPLLPFSWPSIEFSVSPRSFRDLETKPNKAKSDTERNLHTNFKLREKNCTFTPM